MLKDVQPHCFDETRSYITTCLTTGSVIGATSAMNSAGMEARLRERQYYDPISWVHMTAGSGSAFHHGVGNDQSVCVGHTFLYRTMDH